MGSQNTWLQAYLCKSQAACKAGVELHMPAAWSLDAQLPVGNAQVILLGLSCNSPQNLL